MNITILAHGSRGDVQPYLALGLGLARAGHRVRLAAPALFREMIEARAGVEGLPLDFHPLPGDPQQLMRSAADSTRWRLLPGPLRMALTVGHSLQPVLGELIDETRLACREADLVITTLVTSIIGHQVAREVEAAEIAALIFPVFTPTVFFPNPLFAPWPRWAGRVARRAGRFGPRYNYLTHREFNRVFFYANRLVIEQKRKQQPDLIGPLNEWPFGRLEGLPPGSFPARPVPLLYGISRHTLGCPADWLSGASSLPERPGPPLRSCSQLTGYWFLDAAPDWQPPEGLARFLDAGTPPVLISFGSMIPRDTQRLTRLAIDALRLSGQRGVLLSGWAGLDNAERLPPTIYTAGELPYDWLFPHLAAAVHHGGMGTSAAAIRAGIPSVVVPFTFDQPFWGRRMHALGAGPRPIAPGRMNAVQLASAIRAAVENPAMRQRAAQLGQLIRAEDGVGKTVRLVHQLVGR